MKGHLSKYYKYGVLLCWAIVCFLFFQLWYPYHFYFKEQTQLFLYASDYLVTYFDRPAWVACMAGDFFTQFYYYEFAGAIILTIALLILGDTTRRSIDACKGEKISFGIALIVMSIEAVFHFSAGFSISSTFALIGAEVVFLIYTLVPYPRKWIRISVAIVLTMLCYWFFGYGTFVFALLVSVHYFAHRLPWRWNSMALPFVAFGFTAILKIYGIYLLSWGTSLSYPGIGKWMMPRFDIETILALDNEYYFGHTGKVLQKARHTSYKLPEVSYFYNLAQARLGTMPDSLLYFGQPLDQGLFIKGSGPDVALIDLYISSEMYEAWNDMTLEEHAAILANVFSPNNRNVRMIKKLAEVNLINNDTTAAMKYLRILSKTFVYSRWAREHTPGQQTASVKAQLDERRKYINRNDTIREPQDTRAILSALIVSNPNNKTALDYLLCSELLTKNLAAFVQDYNRFCLNTGHLQSADIYQQALMIYLAATKAQPQEWIRYKLKMQLLKDFKSYTDLYQQSHATASALTARFGKTYWYYFHFAAKEER